MPMSMEDNVGEVGSRVMDMVAGEAIVSKFSRVFSVYYMHTIPT
jgi:proteasome assembly chaperone (PAC2) family protein